MTLHRLRESAARLEFRNYVDQRLFDREIDQVFQAPTHRRQQLTGGDIRHLQQLQLIRVGPQHGRYRRSVEFHIVGAGRRTVGPVSFRSLGFKAPNRESRAFAIRFSDAREAGARAIQRKS